MIKFSKMAEEKKDELFSDIDLNAMSVFEEMGDLLESQLDGDDKDTDDDTNKKSKETDDDSSEVIDNDDKNNSKDDPSFNQDDDEDDDSNDDSEDDDDGDDDAKKSNSPITPIAKFLANEGILANFNEEEFDGTSDGLKQIIKDQITNGTKEQINEFLNELPAELHHLIKNYQEGVPFDKLIETGSKRIKYASIDESKLSENEKLQEDIYREFLKASSKFSDSKIEKLISLSKDTGELEEDAKAGLSKLIDMQDEIEEAEAEKIKLAKEKAQKQTEDNLKMFRKKIDSTEELIPNLKISKSIKDRVYKTVTTPVAKDANGNTLNEIAKYRHENPLDFEYILGYLYTVTDKFTNFSKLGSAAKKTVIDELEKAAELLDYDKGTNSGLKKSRGGKRADGDAMSAINDWLNS